MKVLGLLQTTDFNKKIPKQKFYENLSCSSAVKNTFAKQIKTVHWANKITVDTTTLSAGSTVREIQVLRIVLNQEDADERVLLQIDKVIPYHLIFVLEYGDKFKLAAYHKKLIQSKWKPKDTAKIELKGLDLDTVWENIIKQIGNIEVSTDLSLDEQIVIDDKKAKLEKEIARLEKQARAEKQPKKKFELVSQIQVIAKKLTELD